MPRAITRQDVWAAVVLLLLPLLLFWPVTVGPNTLLPVDNLFAYEPWASYKDTLGVGLPQNQLLSDLILENYVWKKFIRESIAAGQLPLWNPYILSGQPFLANGQHSAFYPFSLLFYLMPLSKAYGWFTVIQLWLAGLGMYTFLRTLRVTRWGALIGGITYSLSTFFIVSVVFTMIIAGAVWLPFFLAMIEIILRKQEEKGLTGYSPIPYVVAGALVLGVQTLAGHVEITYYTLLVGSYYALCRLLLLWRRQKTPRFTLRLAGWLVLMVVLGVGLGSVQLVPMYEVVTQNFRDNSVTLAQVREWALPFRRIITFIIPDFFGSPAHHGYFDAVTWRWQPIGLNAHGQENPLCHNCTSWDTKTAVEAGAYLGIWPLVLAALAVAQAVREGWRTGGLEEGRVSASSNPPTLQPSTFIFTILAFLSLLFAFGTPLYALLFYGLPGWNQLHSPFRWIFPFTLSIAVLAGIGLTYLEQFVSVSWEKRQGSRGGGEAERRGDEGEEIPPALQPSSPPTFQPPFGRNLPTISLYTAWFLFWTGLLGLLVMLLALFVPAPFIQAADFVLAHSGLAQNAFADGRQLFGYQWPNFFKFFLMVMASGAVLRIVRCPIFFPSLEGRGRERVSAWLPLAVLLLALDLLLAGAGFNPSVDATLLDFKPPVARWLEARRAEDPFFRINSFDTPEGRGNKVFLANAGMYYNLFDVRGYDSIIPAQYGRFMHLIQENGDLFFNRIGPIYYDGYAALDSALLDLLGVRYVLTTVDINNPNYKLVYNDEIRVYENTDALPRAFVVDEQMPAGDDLALALRNLNPRRQVILDGENNGLGRDLAPEDIVTDAGVEALAENLPIASAKASIPESSAVKIVEYTPNEVRLAVQLDHPGWLVLADAYFPGWRAYARPQTADGRPPDTGHSNQSTSNLQPPTSNPQSEIELTIHRANGAFRSVYLQPGQWEIRFRYSPRSFQLGLYGSFLALVTLLFISGYWTWGKLYRESEADSSIKRVAKNSLVPMVMALSNRLIDFAFALLMLRILQPEGAGRFAFAVAFIGLTEILTRYGLGTLVTREVAAHRAASNRYLSNVSLMRFYLWLIAIPFMGAILGLYVIFGGLTLDVVITIALLAVGTLFSNLSDGLTAIFYAHEKAEYPAAIASITTLTRVSLGALALLLGWGIIGLAGVSLVANLITFLILGYILVTLIFRPTLETDRGLQKEMVGEGLPLMINHLLATIFFRIDVFILSPTWGDAAVGYYNAAYKYIDGINIIPQYFTLALFPLMSRFAADSRDSLIRAYILSLRLLLSLAIPLAVGTPFVARELILFLAGDRYLPDSMIVLQLLIWFLPFSFINQVTQYVLIAIHQQRHLTRAFIIGVLFNLTANLIFIPLYGYRAAAVTTIFSEWALLIPFYLLVRKNLCPVPWFDVVWRPTVAATVMGLCLWFSGDVNFLFTVAIAGVTYLAALALVGGFNQPDMGVVWRALPVGRLSRRFSQFSSRPKT